jgi:hypothetical protein
MELRIGRLLPLFILDTTGITVRPAGETILIVRIKPKAATQGILIIVLLSKDQVSCTLNPGSIDLGHEYVVHDSYSLGI